MTKLMPALVAAGAFALLTMQTHAGFAAVLAAPFLAVWFFYSLVIICRAPERRRLQAARVLVWLVAVSAVAGVHWHKVRASRLDAEQAATAILAYKARHGAYPASLGEVGMDAAMLKKRWLLFYGMHEGNPTLFYAATFVPFETFHYDFEQSQWRHNPD